ncbi:MAG: magnesium transporter CorA family protein [Patescibacteria group bacterium]
MPHKALLFDKNTIREVKLEDTRVKKLIWADIENPNDEEKDFLVKILELDEPKEIKYWLKSNQRPAVFKAGNYTAVFFSIPQANRNLVFTAPLLFFVSQDRNDILTVHRGKIESITKIHSYHELRRLRVFKGGITNVLLMILEEVVDSYFGYLDQLSDRIENIEDRMFDYRQSRQVMKQTLAVKKSLIYLHRALIANREVVTSIERQYLQFFDEERQRDFRELSLKIVQLIEMISTYRDVLTSTIEIHMSTISNNLNVTMKKITAWGALILVPSLIAGIFGMNFHEIPLLTSHEGFYLSLAMMVASVFILARYFQKKDWL